MDEFNEWAAAQNEAKQSSNIVVLAGWKTSVTGENLQHILDLTLENGIMLQAAEEYEDMPVEYLLGNILALAQDFQRVYECGRGDEKSELNEPTTINYTAAENSMPIYWLCQNDTDKLARRYILCLILELKAGGAKNG